MSVQSNITDFFKTSRTTRSSVKPSTNTKNLVEMRRLKRKNKYKDIVPLVTLDLTDSPSERTDCKMADMRVSESEIDMGESQTLDIKVEESEIDMRESQIDIKVGESEMMHTRVEESQIDENQTVKSEIVDQLERDEPNKRVKTEPVSQESPKTPKKSSPKKSPKIRVRNRSFLTGQKSTPIARTLFPEPNELQEPRANRLHVLNLTFEPYDNPQQVRDQILTDPYSGFLLHVVKSVLTHKTYADYFPAHLTRVLRTFIALSRDECKLCVRTYFLKHTWHRLDALRRYVDNDLTRVKCLAERLCELGIFARDYERESLSTLLGMLTTKELAVVAKCFKVRAGAKHVIVDALLKLLRTQPTVFGRASGAKEKLMARVRECLKDMVRVSEDLLAALYRAQMLFMLTETPMEIPRTVYQTLWEYVNSGGRAHAQFHVDQARVFASVADLDVYEHVHKIHDKIAIKREKKTNDDIDIVGECLKCYQTFLNLLKTPNPTKSPAMFTRFQPGHVLAGVITACLDDVKKEITQNTHVKRDVTRELFGTERLTFANYVEMLTTLLDQTLYKTSKRAFWYEQLALTHEHYAKDYVATASTCLTALAELMASGENACGVSLSLRKRARKLLDSRRFVESQEDGTREQLEAVLAEECVGDVLVEGRVRSITLDAHAMPGNEAGQKRRYIYTHPRTHERTYGLSVEDIAMQYYKTNENYMNGAHVEGRFVHTLYLLLFWRVIYTHVPNAFISPVQTFPLDMFSSKFYDNRRELCDAELATIRDATSDELGARVYAQADALKEEKCLNMDLMDVNALVEITHALGPAIIARLCDRLCKNYGFARAGFPDLMVWSEEFGQYKFVEVKGQNDTLSPKQILWLDYLHEIGANVEICYVRTVGTRERRRGNSLAAL